MSSIYVWMKFICVIISWYLFVTSITIQINYIWLWISFKCHTILTEPDIKNWGLHGYNLQMRCALYMYVWSLYMSDWNYISGITGYLIETSLIFQLNYTIVGQFMYYSFLLLKACKHPGLEIIILMENCPRANYVYNQEFHVWDYCRILDWY